METENHPNDEFWDCPNPFLQLNLSPSKG